MRFVARGFRGVRLVFAVAALGLPASAAAQVKVTREAELSASIFFGNNSQRLAASRLGLTRADSSFSFTTGFRYTYADIEDDETGIRAVNRRSWDLGASLDWRPFNRLSPFVSGGVESSLEKEIELRYSFGAGAKLVITRDSVREHNLAASVLGEKTTPRVETPDFNDDLLARWSVAHTLKGKLSAAVSYSSVTLYKPAFSDMGDYSISSVNSLGILLSSTLSFTFTFIDNYDSEARTRGAESNNDGQLLFGLKAVW
jgi:hypothetical protein